MADEMTDPLADVLLFGALLPMSWRSIEAPPRAASVAHWQERNERLLQALNVAEGHRAEGLEEEHDPTHALRRLESKVDLILDILSALARVQNLLPGEREIRLSAKGIGWMLGTDEVAPATADWVAVKLYLEPHYPQGLEVIGRIQNVHPRRGAHEVVMVFEGLGDKVEEVLTKYIFRQHRQQVALDRGSSV